SLLVSPPPGVKDAARETTREPDARERTRVTGPTTSREASRSPPPDVALRRVRAGLRARERSGLSAGFLLFSASQPRGVSAFVEVRSRLPLRGSPGLSPGSLFARPYRPEHQHEMQRTASYGHSQPYLVGHVLARPTYGAFVQAARSA